MLVTRTPLTVDAVGHAHLNLHVGLPRRNDRAATAHPLTAVEGNWLTAMQRVFIDDDHIAKRGIDQRGIVFAASPRASFIASSRACSSSALRS